MSSSRSPSRPITHRSMSFDFVATPIASFGFAPTSRVILSKHRVAKEEAGLLTPTGSGTNFERLPRLLRREAGRSVPVLNDRTSIVTIRTGSSGR